MNDFTTLGMKVHPHKIQPRQTGKKDSRSRELPLPRVRALFLLSFDYVRQRKPDSLGGIPQEVLVFKEAEGRVENGYTRNWVSPATNVLAIPFQKLTSVRGKWIGNYGVVRVQAEGDLGGNHRCVPDEKVPDWGKKITTEQNRATVGEFEPKCSVELPITEAHVHKTINVAVRMNVTRPVLVPGEAPQGSGGLYPVVGVFENTREEVSREFQLFVASPDEAKRMHHFKNQQTSSPLGPINIDVVFSLLSLGALGGAVLLWR
jgi:hypothetical protein